MKSSGTRKKKAKNTRSAPQPGTSTAEDKKNHAAPVPSLLADSGADEVMDPMVFDQDSIAPTLGDYVESLNHSKVDEVVLHIISFDLGGEEYALEAGCAVEVIRPRRFTEVPNAPEFIKGVLSVRGEMVAVMDLKTRLGVESRQYGPYFRILVAQIEDEKIGLMVDRVAGVIEAPTSLVETDGPSRKRPHAGFLKGAIHLGGRHINLLDLEKLLGINEVQG